MGEIIWYSWGEFLPDLSNFRNPGLMVAQNVVPIRDYYVPRPAPTRTISAQLEAGSTNNTLGLHIHVVGNKTYDVFAGGAAKLYRKPTGTQTVSDVTRASGGDYTTSDEFGWQFTSYGQTVMATNYVDDIQYFPAGASAFAKNNLTTSPTTADPKSKVIGIIKNHVLLGNYIESGTAVPNGVWWSGTDTPRRFSTQLDEQSVIGTGRQALEDDYGHVTGIAGGDFALIFKTRGIIRMDGPEFTFRSISRGVGCIYPNSIVQVGEDCYFWGDAGPMVVRGGDGMPVPLGASRLVRSLLDNTTAFSSIDIAASIVNYGIAGAHDAANGLIFWSYPLSSNTHLGSGLLVYNYVFDRFSTMSFADSSPEYCLPLMKTAPNTGVAWTLGRDVVFVRRSIDGAEIIDRACAFRVDPIEDAKWYSVLKSGYTAAAGEGVACMIPRVRPVYSYAADSSYSGTITVTIRTKESPFGVATSASSFSTNRDGWIDIPDTFGAYKQIEISASGSPITIGTEFEGVEAEIVTGGAS